MTNRAELTIDAIFLETIQALTRNDAARLTELAQSTGRITAQRIESQTISRKAFLSALLNVTARNLRLLGRASARKKLLRED
jgi:hypothetical protein